MAAKIHAHTTDQSLLGHHVVRPESPSTLAHEQPIRPVHAAQHARMVPRLLRPADALQLQRTHGHQAVARLLASPNCMISRIGLWMGRQIRYRNGLSRRTSNSWASILKYWKRRKMTTHPTTSHTKCLSVN